MDGGAGGNAGGGGLSTAKTPADFLKSIRGRPVVVKLNSGVDYRGILACLDGYMNIAMEQTEEYVNGQLKNKYGDAFIRGNNGMSPYYTSARRRGLSEISEKAADVSTRIQRKANDGRESFLWNPEAFKSSGSRKRGWSAKPDLPELFHYEVFMGYRIKVFEEETLKKFASLGEST